MSSTTDIFGSIGAAKIFCGNLSGSLGDAINLQSEKEDELDQEYEAETDEKKKAKLKKKRDKKRKSIEKMNRFKEKIQNATDFLAKLAEKVDISKKDIIEFLAKIIVQILPSVEVAVKAILLSNLKKAAGCSMDFNIPDSYRSDGILINEKQIDPRMSLLISPTSEYSSCAYFGVETNDGPYTLARAEDMNAFIWFVKHCAKFVNPIVTNGKMTEYFIPDNEEDGTTNFDDNSLLTADIYIGNDNHPLTVGTTLKDATKSNTIYLIQKAYSNDTHDHLYSIVPITNTFTSVNWYTKQSSIYGKRLGTGAQKPLFRLEYANTYNSSAELPLNNFRFKILPKPFEIGSSILTDLGNDVNIASDTLNQVGTELIASGMTTASLKESLSSMKWPSVSDLMPHKALFDIDGTYNKSGVYTIDESRFTVTLGTSSKDNVVIYNLYQKQNLELIDNNGNSSTSLILEYDRTESNFSLKYGTENGGNIRPIDATKALIECYKGKTVFEFNYDYIMSFKLFDAKVIATNIINNLMSVSVPLSLDALLSQLKKLVNKDEQAIASQNQVYLNTMTDKMIQKLLDEETSEYTSCFYSFDNEEYNEMEEQTALKIINGQMLTEETVSGLTEAYSILDAYSADASLNEQTEIITRALMSGIESNTSNTDNSCSSLASDTSTNTSDDDTIVGFIKRAIKSLIEQIMYSILSPKVLMLIAINQKLMGNDPFSLDKNYDYSIKDIINSMSSILSTIAKQIIDMVQKELLRIILARITQIMNKYLQALMLEYAQKWVNFIKSLLSCFKLSRSKVSSNSNDINDAINAALNQVDYADLDELAGQILPNSNPC